VTEKVSAAHGVLRLVVFSCEEPLDIACPMEHALAEQYLFCRVVEGSG